jgi:phosphoribosylformimino-5-aminoimidazole carboxamide ribonucleotide (ProFAR) isomerase
MSGVVSVPRQFVERTLPPTPELATGRTVKLNVAELQKCNLPQAQFLALTGKYANKVCKVLRIIELQDAQDPLGRKYYAMVGLKDSLEKDSPHSIPVEALETVQ